MLNNEEITALALDWAIDYKPWAEDMEYREYARHGFEVGYKRAVKDMQAQLEEMR